MLFVLFLALLVAFLIAERKQFHVLFMFCPVRFWPSVIMEVLQSQLFFIRWSRIALSVSDYMCWWVESSVVFVYHCVAHTLECGYVFLYLQSKKVLGFVEDENLRFYLIHALIMCIVYWVIHFLHLLHLFIKAGLIIN
jgi:hypothetical protein